MMVRPGTALASPGLFLAISVAMEYHARSIDRKTASLSTTRIYVDADACPVKDEIYRVATRHGLPVSVVAGNFIRVPQDPLIERVAAGSGMDAADDWIAERAGQATSSSPRTFRWRAAASRPAPR